MVKPNFLHRLSLIFLVAFLVVMCKNQEKITQPASKVDINPCKQLTQENSDDALLFIAETESNRKQVATKKAENKTVIQLVQFFQSEFIKGRQIDLFGGSERLGNQTTWQTMEINDAFRKDWAEMSYEMIGIQHNQNAFTHNQKVVEDSTGYIVYDLLIVPDNWIRNHWEKSLAATDSSFYENVTESKYYQEVMEMDIRQQPPCESF